VLFDGFFNPEFAENTGKRHGARGTGSVYFETVLAET